MGPRRISRLSFQLFLIDLIAIPIGLVVASWLRWVLPYGQDLPVSAVTLPFPVYLLITMPATVGFSVFSRELVLLLSTVEYEASASVVPFLALSNTIWGVVAIVSIGYGIAKKS